MTPDEFLQEVYDNFLVTAEWPLVRELQVNHLDTNIRQMANKLG